jgi:hypothetical protein
MDTMIILVAKPISRIRLLIVNQKSRLLMYYTIKVSPQGHYLNQAGVGFKLALKRQPA